RRKNSTLYIYVKWIINSSWFSALILVTVTVNAFMLALQTDYKTQYQLSGMMQVDTAPRNRLMKNGFCVYIAPFVYHYIVFNTSKQLLLMTILVLRGLTCYCGLHNILILFPLKSDLLSIANWTKMIVWYSGTEALMTALVKTIKSVMYVLTLLFLLMYIFAIMGYYYFGDPDTGAPMHWGNLGSAFFTLFSLVTVDGWTDIQEELDRLGFEVSRTFTILFILLGYFLFFNMFIAVVILNIQQATEHFEKKIQIEREVALNQKKHNILVHQQEEVQKLLKNQSNNASNYENVGDILKRFKKTLHHDDYTITYDISASLSAADIYLSTLDRQDKTI
uniref:Cation channel sperm associated 3 n=1 Tax=Latimeria chalumnae TaxID=7897 RepID=H3A794_LATCH